MSPGRGSDWQLLDGEFRAGNVSSGSISPLQALVKLSLSAAMCCPKFNDRTTFNSCHWR